MIVADTNLIDYLFIQGHHSARARDVVLCDPDWNAPALWKSEFRSIPGLYIRPGHLSVNHAVPIMNEAVALETPLVTSDKQLLRLFPAIARSMDDFPATQS